MYFRNYGLQKTWLDRCLKSLVSEDPSIGNMVNGPTVEIWTTTTLSYLLITIKIIQLEKVSLSDMQNHSTVS